MKIILFVLFLVGGALLLCGKHVERSGRSQDESLASVIPYLLGLTCWGLDVVLLIGWGLVRLFSS